MPGITQSKRALACRYEKFGMPMAARGITEVRRTRKQNRFHALRSWHVRAISIYFAISIRLITYI